MGGSYVAPPVPFAPTRAEAEKYNIGTPEEYIIHTPPPEDELILVESGREGASAPLSEESAPCPLKGAR